MHNITFTNIQTDFSSHITSHISSHLVENKFVEEKDESVSLQLVCTLEIHRKKIDDIKTP